MPRNIVVEHLNATDLQHQSKDLLHIANIDPSRLAEKRVMRSEARDILLVARAIALLVELALARNWDHVFWILDGRVYMRFPGEDLLATERHPVSEVVRYLRDFNGWRDARLLMVVRGLDDGEAAGGECRDKVSIEAARNTLSEFRTRKAPSGKSLDDIFARWVADRARVREFNVMAGSPEEPAMHTRLPARAQIVAPLLVTASGRAGVAADPGKKVAACMPCQLIQTPAGKTYLVVQHAGSDQIKGGTWMAFPSGSEHTVSRWQLVVSGSDVSASTEHRGAQ